jgi:heme/copper-type cytochrome/quinol oxidase subunit 2
LLAASHEYAVKGNYMLIVTTLGSALLYLQAAPADQDALSEMNDLGMYMLLGFVIAVLGAVALTIIRLRIRDKKPEAPQFISIQAREED